MPKKKQNLKKTNVTHATAHMEHLIAAHEAAVQDGRLEVATAIAMTSDMVTVDASVDPFTTDPSDLFTRPFNDPKVGIMTPSLMRTFLANLKALLPQISTDIDQIPENPAIKIQLVARLVRLALLQG